MLWRQKKGGVDKFKVQAHTTFIFSQRRLAVWNSDTASGRVMDCSVGFVTFRCKNRVSDLLLVILAPISNVFQCATTAAHALFLFFFSWNKLKTPSASIVLLSCKSFYIHQPASKTSHTEYERETCISQNKCGIKYNWLLLNPPTTHTPIDAPPHPHPQPTPLPPTHPPLPYETPTLHTR